jgi:hypothetical protein
MRTALLALLISVATGAGTANAQSSRTNEPGEPAATEPGEPRAESPTPNITVKEDRLICRRRERTGTRMGTSRVCRTQAEWNQVAQDLARNAEETSDTLDVLGADDISTGDLGGMGPSHDGPLGPR